VKVTVQVAPGVRWSETSRFILKRASLREGRALTREQLQVRIAELTAEIDRTSNCGHTARHAAMEALAQQYDTPADDRIAERSILRARLDLVGWRVRTQNTVLIRARRFSAQTCPWTADSRYCVKPGFPR
jgi:hypothetical protein